jgi:hypothetical protein
LCFHRKTSSLFFSFATCLPFIDSDALDPLRNIVDLAATFSLSYLCPMG